MPSTLFTEMDHNTDGLEDHQRALQSLAFNLSMLGLSNEDDGPSAMDDRGRKSSNMTECVPVPSSEHVAEIVGRQGCKIKALRAKTNTYIKTPVRGEEPVFVVTGRKEDVAAAKREILQAAEHFSQIRAKRNQGHSGVPPGPPPPNIPGQTTIQVRVPYRVVGLVVGPKGATIKRIQQQTNTYIVTPSRDNEPVFEVTGLPDSVEQARQEIEAHIAMRTGGLIDSTSPEDDFANNGTDRGMVDDISLYKTGPSPFAQPVGGAKPMIQRSSSDNYFFPTNITTTSTSTTTTNGTTEFNPLANSFTSTAKTAYNLFNGSTPELGVDSHVYEGPLPATGIPTQQQLSMWQDLTGVNAAFGIPQISRRSSSISSGSNEPAVNGINEHPPARRIRSDPLNGGLSVLPTPLPSAFPVTSSSSTCSSPTDSIGSGSLSAQSKKQCMVCSDNEIVAALVPCGHNLFCMECANSLINKENSPCPMCHEPVTQAIRIQFT
ncbi:RNA-binding protein MEX3B-like [Lytechinus variegatus]|uniref:RNA-binding protein MEX3B-like n=1 Tax=Lytechinus variegatus TaxID=7654 RepID=UPI001BB2A4D1|nr:RNA-binding protein MEX3B-like [Lytechinus variegatus]XP_041465543.1 RNA-binding protein MEX3B-like [Lytechinus variegatus]